MAEAGPSVENLSLEESADGDYKAPEKKSINELLSSEGKADEDEALQRYKASLLGAAAAGGGSSSDPRRVVITEMQVIINGHDPLVFDMTKEEHLKGGLKVQLKEGCEYRMQLSFRVQNELISGLKYKNKVSKGGMITVLSVDEMLGSYAPDPEKVNTIVFPRREWEEAPSGMLARGNYKAKTEFIDDDKVSHLAFEYTLAIAKDWA